MKTCSPFSPFPRASKSRGFRPLLRGSIVVLLLAAGSAPAADLDIDVFVGNSPYSFSSGTASYATIRVGFFPTLSGQLDQSGGSLTTTGLAIGVGFGNQGIFNLSGGTFTVAPGQSPSVTVGVAQNSMGTLNQTGGTFDATGQHMEIGESNSIGMINLSGNSSILRAGSESVGNLGTGTFTQSGGSHIVSGAITIGYEGGSSGTYHLNGGTLQAAQVTGRFGTSTFNFNGGTLQARVDQPGFFAGLTRANVRNGGAIIDSNGFNVTLGQALEHSTISGDNAADGGLAKNSLGTLTLTGASTYTGATAVTGGALVIQNLATGSNNANLLGGKVFTTSALNVSTGAVVQLDLGATSFASTNAGLTWSGGGTIRKSGTGVWWLGNPGGGTVISMSAGGLIDVQGGVLRNDYSNANWSGNAATLNIAAGATVDLRNNAIAVGAITGAGTIDNGFVTAQTLTVGMGNGSGTFTGNFASSGGAAIGFTKVGAGTQTLSGAGVTYTGTTTVSAGKLALFNANAFNSPTTIASGATLAWSGNADSLNTDTAATIALNAGGTLENLNPARRAPAAVSTCATTTPPSPARSSSMASPAPRPLPAAGLASGEIPRASRASISR